MVSAFDFRMRTLGGDLGRAVASIWYARGRIPYRREKVAPTGSSVAVIVLGDPIVETPGGRHAVPFRAAHGFLIGPHDQPVTNAPSGETFAVGIVTTPVGARAALGVDPVAIAGGVVDLLAAWPPSRALRETLLATPDDPEGMLDLVGRTLANHVSMNVPGIERCERAVALLAADPTRPIASVAGELGVSHGHLDREFTRIVGLSPRRLARLLRVERLLAAIDIDARVPWADLAAELGWTDQSHLIRDFRRHTGSTPSTYLAARRSYPSPDAAPVAARFVPEAI
jgi:AraC-like DNA-binding protein